MIQRIQSVFLALAALLNLSSLFLPLWKAGAAPEEVTISGMRIETATSINMFSAHPETGTLVAHSAMVLLTVLASAWLIWVIFQFRQRVRQLRFAYIGILMLCVQILALVWLTLQFPSDPAGPLPGGAAPILALVLSWLAARGIRKDEELVRSVDRIR